jgi:hypothetical protein
MAKKEVKVNEDVLKNYTSPSRELLRKEEYNFQVGRTIMTEEEFDKLWNNG